ncbi:GT2 family glycosyltransferase [Pedobacter sp. UYP30]|uniref:glycosyltransferase family 2 protein n=1 Tax=Pedobacter sp. UYP30 TaxID=1756400 RepID=UPI003396C856
MSSVSIITVNFNQFEVNIDFLKSIKEHAGSHNLELIFVDNGSLEQHEALYKEIFPELIYIRSDQNLGFAGGNNLGVAVAKHKHLLFLNNDVEISEHFIDVMVAKMESNSQIGLLSPLILYFDDPETIQYAGFSEMNYVTCRNTGIGFGEINKQQYATDDRETGYCHGAAMMCRNADLKEVGTMAENYFLYYEELDWCERFKKAGKKIWFIGNTHIFHKESMSVGKESRLKSYFMTRNRMLFIRKNTGLLNTIVFYCYFIGIASLKQVLIYLIKSRTDLAKCVLDGILWNFTHSKNSTHLGFKTTR